jgi:hypothetical protein
MALHGYSFFMFQNQGPDQMKVLISILEHTEQGYDQYIGYRV